MINEDDDDEIEVVHWNEFQSFQLSWNMIHYFNQWAWHELQFIGCHSNEFRIANVVCLSWDIGLLYVTSLYADI